MRPNFEEYAEMVGDLAAGGFTPKQSEALVAQLAALFSRQDEFLERIRSEDGEDRQRIEKESRAYYERICREDKEDRERLEQRSTDYFERIRREDREDRARLEVRFDAKLDSLEVKLDAAIAGMSRWTITTLTTLVLSVLGASIIYALRFTGA